ncbi:MAG: inositol monophosphatase, partial [Synechococcus sp. H1_metabat_bins_2.tsv.006]|nr:inositol monophosphatase [Synechococcus sp. H1_metabat_bins_2.tsv.006]
DVYKRQELQWCVDPLDGTTNYAHGFPFFACSIGLLRQGKPLLGAIAAPGLNQRYSGGLGLGAWCNEEPLKVSSCQTLADSLLVTGFAYDRRERIDNNYSEFCYFSHRTHGVRRGGAAALDLAFVAAGRLDGYWERGLQPWDLAAGIALVEAAGGVVCDYDGSPVELSTGRVVATNTALQGPLLQGLAECQPLPPATYNAEIPAGP